MCCAASSALLALSFPIFSQQKKPVVYKRIVPIDDAFLSDGKLCVPFAVAMTSGNFFDGLRATEMRSGRIFYKRDERITEFPAQTTIFVRASMLGCSQFPYVPVSSNDAKDFMGALNFTLEWQSQLRRRPVEVSSSRLVAPGPSVWPENEKPVAVWSYIFIVKTQGVPLTDDLIITVRSETNKLVSRMGVHL
jgi:hypothetical protein